MPDVPLLLDALRHPFSLAANVILERASRVAEDGAHFSVATAPRHDSLSPATLHQHRHADTCRELSSRDPVELDFDSKTVQKTCKQELISSRALIQGAG